MYKIRRKKNADEYEYAFVLHKIPIEFAVLKVFKL